jgi:type I restriction enzyme, S subunit
MEIKKLSEVTTIIMGQSPPSSSYNNNFEGLPFFQGKTDFGELHPIERVYCNEPQKIALNQDILMSVRAPVGDLNIANKESCIGRGLAAIRVNQNFIDSKYLYYYLSYKKNVIENMGTGSTFKAISKKDLESIEVILFDLEVQKKIVKILDTSNQLIKNRKGQITALNNLTQSVFLEMFGDPVSNTKNYRKIPLKELGDIQTGNTPSRKVKDYYGNYIEWIKSDNINTPNDFLTTAEEYLSKEGMKKARVVPAGSILVTCIAGSFDCIGNAAISKSNVAFNQQINSITPKKGMIDTYFLYNQVKFGKKLIQQASTNSMKGMVSKSKFKEIMFIVPDIKEQEVFRIIYLKIEAQKVQLEKSLVLLENNLNVLMQRAFKGELTFKSYC